MVSPRLLHRLGAAVAALGVALIILGVTSIVFAMTTYTPGPFTRWQEQLYYIITNVEAIVFRTGIGLAMTALGLYLRHHTGRQLAQTEEQP